MRKLTCLFPLLFCVTLSSFSALAQDVPHAPGPAPEMAAPTEMAWVRAWAVLGTPHDKAQYNLSYKGQNGESGKILEDIRGSFKTGFGAGYSGLPAGKYLFVLHEQGKSMESGAHVIAELTPGSGHTLVAYLVEGEPKLMLVREHPVEPGQDGVFIYNLLDEPALELLLGEEAPSTVPPLSRAGTSLHLGASTPGGAARLSYLNHRRSRVSAQLTWQAGVRSSAVFLRSMSGRPSILILPSIPIELNK